MKILVYGISGRTGRLVAEEALRRGWKVNGIARNSSRVTLPGAEITEGNTNDIETVRKAMEGCDAVVSTLSLFPASQGLFSKLTSPGDFMSVSTQNTITVMKEKGIRRVVIMTALGVGDSYNQIPFLFKVMINLSNLKHAYADHKRQESLLENSGLDWTVIRPVMLTEKDMSLPVVYNLHGKPKLGTSVTRRSVADFIIQLLEENKFIGEKPGVSN